jgi:signal transduction histidine kinase
VSVRWRVTVASVVLALLIAGAFAVLLLAIRDVRAAERRTHRSQEVLLAATQLERLLPDLEGSQREFVLTGQERFLAPWNAAQRAFPRRSAALLALVTGEAEREASDVVRVQRSYIDDYSIPLVRAARRGDPSAQSAATTAEGKRRAADVRASVDRLLEAERLAAAHSSSRADSATNRAYAAAAVGVAASLVLIALYAAYLSRAIVVPVRRAAQMAGRLSGGDLSARMPETGPGEIGALEHAFNDMAGSLERSRDDLAASRARVVATADETRRRIERDLHDGAQQRLVSLTLQLRSAQASVPADLRELRAELDRVAAGLTEALDDLRELARGIHPAILAEGGLGPALKTLARRSAVPVTLDVRAGGRLPKPVEVCAYYVVSEALANTAKHARASSADVNVHADGRVLRVTVRDDGAGGASFGEGSGLVGLRDRVEALGGHISMDSPRGAGTTLAAELPLSG